MFEQAISCMQCHLPLTVHIPLHLVLSPAPTPPPGAQVLYRLQPQARQEALDMITDVSDHMQGRTRPVSGDTQQPRG